MHLSNIQAIMKGRHPKFEGGCSRHVFLCRNKLELQPASDVSTTLDGSTNPTGKNVAFNFVEADFEYPKTAAGYYPRFGANPIVKKLKSIHILIDIGSGNVFLSR